jgi:hypothetical protein
MSQRPVAVALLLCEQVIVDDRTKRLTPVNCFSRWFIAGPLSEQQSFHAVAVLTSGHGTVPGALMIDRLDTGETIVQREFRLRFADPVEQYSCLLPLRRVKFPVGGVYQATLLMDGDSIASTRFSVLHKE